MWGRGRAEAVDAEALQRSARVDAIDTPNQRYPIARWATDEGAVDFASPPRTSPWNLRPLIGQVAHHLPCVFLSQPQRSHQLVNHAELVAQEMRAWALLGNSDKVSSTRWRAEKAIAKLPLNTPTRGTFSISLADDPYTATSLLLLGRHAEAVEVTRQVIATFYGSLDGEGRREYPSGFARTHLILALALAGFGKLDKAYAAGSMALEAPRLVWPVAVLAGKLDRALMGDFANTTEAVPITNGT